LPRFKNYELVGTNLAVFGRPGELYMTENVSIIKFCYVTFQTCERIKI
jgi:hypothetical protein